MDRASLTPMWSRTTGLGASERESILTIQMNEQELRRVDPRDRLDAHLRRWLGAVPVVGEARMVVHPGRDEPRWDGIVRPVQGIIGPEGGVLSVSPRLARAFAGVDPAEVFAVAAGRDGSRQLSDLLGMHVAYGMPVFRWAESAVTLPEVGTWVEADHPRIPAWLRPFNGGVLVAFDRAGRAMAGVGLKRHNALAREIAVGTDMGYRGRGLATKLVAQAARTILGAGEVPIYQHGSDNPASARVAEATGFPDRGWRMLEIHPDRSGAIRG
jgi:RimJ/RimL family protein N-acetyltransferase